MLQAKFVLKEPKSEEPSLINLIYRYNNIRFKYSTGWKIKPKYWNSKTQKARETVQFDKYAELNTLLKNLASEVEDAHARLIAATERELYSQAIQLASGDQSKAAKWLGVSLPTIREKLLRYGLHPRKKAKPSAQPEPASRAPALEAG